ncbi:MAG: hypothetical protein IPP99_11775 [Chitinophagaceae bacterium]|nr:hypothetical protein [Chitinophagaceae bacterium]
MNRLLLIIFMLLGIRCFTIAQAVDNKIDSFRAGTDILISVDRPLIIQSKRPTVLVLYALPNGNSTAQTMGKKMQEGDDWHFDIQHIRAQTAFIRREWKKTNLIVVYLENNYRSWPAWKQKHPDFKEKIPKLVDSLATHIGGKGCQVYLNGHSGGGSFIFGYLAGVQKIPSFIKRISFLDSNYGYDSSYYPVLRQWLQKSKQASLTVFAYNDSVALYNGKPVVSATGGTWYRSWMMVKHFSLDWNMDYQPGDSIQSVFSKKKNIQFYFKSNLNQGIYHTQQVEYNGFIHSILAGTPYDSRRYQYYGHRAYQEFIR